VHRSAPSVTTPFGSNSTVRGSPTRSGYCSRGTIDRQLSSRIATILALLASAYVAAQMLADVTSPKLTKVAGWSVDARTLVYPITFTHRHIGVDSARLFGAACPRFLQRGRQRPYLTS
jgi:hypothetical protein